MSKLIECAKLKIDCKIATGMDRQKAMHTNMLQAFVEIETPERRYVLQQGYLSDYLCAVYKKGEQQDHVLELDGDFSFEDGLGYMLKRLLILEEMIITGTDELVPGMDGFGEGRDS